MSYIYTYGTDLGYIPRFTDEQNTLVDLLPEGRYASYAQPSQAFKDSGCVLVVQPIAGSPDILTEGRESLSVEEMRQYVGKQIGRTRSGMPIILGEPVNIQSLPDSDKKNITKIAVDIPGHSPIIIMALLFVLALICVVATVIQKVMKYYETVATAEAEEERQKTLQALADLLAQRMTREYHETYDLNNDGEDDIAVDTWGNGLQVRYAISDYGASVYGTEVEETKPAEPLPEGFLEAAYCPMGTIWDPVTKSCKEYTPYWAEEEWWQSLIYWGIIGAVVIGGVIVAVKVIPPLLAKKKGGE